MSPLVSLFILHTTHPGAFILYNARTIKKSLHTSDFCDIAKVFEYYEAPVWNILLYKKYNIAREKGN